MAKTRQQVEEALLNKSSDFKQCFLTATGESVLKALEEEFNSDTIFNPNSDSATAYALGQRDVVIYIKQMLKYKTEN